MSLGLILAEVVEKHSLSATRNKNQGFHVTEQASFETAGSDRLVLRQPGTPGRTLVWCWKTMWWLFVLSQAKVLNKPFRLKN